MSGLTLMKDAILALINSKGKEIELQQDIYGFLATSEAWMVIVCYQEQILVF